MNVALRPDSLNIISLCTGGGGLDLGVELAMPGARSVVLVEREAFAVSHLVSAIQEGLMASAAIWSDVTTFNGRPWRGLVDGLIGGIPCQPHSLAGKRLGEDDERDLWSDARRIIVQSGAWFVLIENVRGIVSSGGAERVWRDLCRLGFDVEAGLFTASEVGASHERERWFCLAVADSESHQRRSQLQPRSPRRGWPGLAGVCREDVADASSERGPAGFSGSIGPDQKRNAGEFVHGRYALDDAIGGGRSARRYDHGGDVGDEPHSAGEHALEHATGERWREGWPKPEFRSGRSAIASTDRTMGHAVSSGHDGRENVAIGRQVGRAIAEGSGERFGLFPPGPSDLHSWRRTLERAPELEPAFRRVADGLASRLDVARVDRLRLLGNGVVSLEAAYAVRTLAARLAASGSAAAARLVRMMALSHPSQDRGTA